MGVCSLFLVLLYRAHEKVQHHLTELKNKMYSFLIQPGCSSESPAEITKLANVMYTAETHWCHINGSVPCLEPCSDIPQARKMSSWRRKRDQANMQLHWMTRERLTKLLEDIPLRPTARLAFWITFLLQQQTCWAQIWFQQSRSWMLSQTPINLTVSPWRCTHTLEGVRLRAVRMPWAKAFKAKQPIITHCSLSE